MKPRLRHKYNAQPATRDGYRFDSKKEARRYDELVLLRKAGEVVIFLRQVPFHLPGGVVLRLDFVVFWASGEVSFEDVKGMKTEQYKAKKRMVETLYSPVRIEEK